MTITCTTYRETTEDGKETVRVFKLSREDAQRLASGTPLTFESNAVSIMTPSKYRFEIE